ncbi:RNA-binding protein CP31B, chloroplastic [Vigna umbellata]|uniref:RNA-binding protein CP31B, chloroplastic n=1 Tax=Vigna umbellata TaxID=87088 RepID=UPI001F5F5A71|nr:RNA-binding protein CP31B, chloroplastic [Vigna umbellata]
MATLESALTLFAPQRFSDNYRSSAKPPHSIKLHTSTSLFFSSKASFKSARLCFQLCSALQELPTTEKTPDSTQPTDNLTKLYVANLPWTLSPADIKNLFAQCGPVTDVEIIRNKKGRHMGYAFVTMDSGEEAQAALDKFDTYELSGRIIRVEFAKQLNKPPPSPSPSPPPPSGRRNPRETRHVLYVSNLTWKARSTHLRQIFTENFKTPVSARVVFDSPSKRSAGYGFVSFLTKEDAEAAISAVDGKELMGRPLRLTFSEKKDKEAGGGKEEDQIKDAGIEDEDQSSDAQPEES